MEELKALIQFCESPFSALARLKLKPGNVWDVYALPGEPEASK